MRIKFRKNCGIDSNSHSVNCPFLLRVEPSTKFSKKKKKKKWVGLTGFQFLEGDCWERRGDFFKGEGKRERGGAPVFM